MSEAWERMKPNGTVVGVDQNGDRYTKTSSKHEQEYMPLLGQDGASQSDVNNRRVRAEREDRR